MTGETFGNEFPKANLVELLRPSPIFAFFSVLPLFVLSTIGLFFAIMVLGIFVLTSVVISLIAFYRYTSITKTRYIITTETIIVRTGIMARKFEHLELFRIKDFMVSQSVLERIFGLMTIKLYTTDISTSVLTIRAIPRSNITETIRNLVKETRLNNRILEMN